LGTPRREHRETPGQPVGAGLRAGRPGNAKAVIPG